MDPCCICANCTNIGMRHEHTICLECSKDTSLVDSIDNLQKKLYINQSDLYGYGYKMYHYLHYNYIDVKDAIDMVSNIYKNNPKKLKRILKIKGQIEGQRKNQINYNNLKDNIITSVKVASDKFATTLDFDSNSVKKRINNRFEQMYIHDSNLTNLLINDLSDYATFISNKDNAQKLVEERRQQLNKLVYDFTHHRVFNSRTTAESDMLMNKILNSDDVKPIYDTFCFKDKGDIDILWKQLESISGGIVGLYVNAIKAKNDLAKCKEELLKYDIVFE